MADQDILQAIRIIDEKIASLQEARNRLASAFGVNEFRAEPGGSLDRLPHMSLYFAKL